MGTLDVPKKRGDFMVEVFPPEFPTTPMLCERLPCGTITGITVELEVKVQVVYQVGVIQIFSQGRRAIKV